MATEHFRTDFAHGVTVAFDEETENWTGAIITDYTAWVRREINNGITDPCMMKDVQKIERAAFAAVSCSFGGDAPRRRVCKDGRVKVENFRIPAEQYHCACNLIEEIESVRYSEA